MPAGPAQHRRRTRWIGQRRRSLSDCPHRLIVSAPMPQAYSRRSLPSLASPSGGRGRGATWLCALRWRLQPACSSCWELGAGSLAHRTQADRHTATGRVTGRLLAAQCTARGVACICSPEHSRRLVLTWSGRLVIWWAAATVHTTAGRTIGVSLDQA